MKKNTVVLLIILIIAGGSAGVYFYHSGSHDKKTNTHVHEAKQTLYTCPMHPQIISERPGDCPICGMKLVPLKEAGTKQADEPQGLTAVAISPEKKKLLGISFEDVRVRHLHKEIRTSARIVPDETRVSKVTAKFEGWVEKLYVNQTGQFVQQGAPLASIYSQELFSAQQEYLSAIKADNRFEQMPGASLKETIKGLRAASREKLKLYDVSDAQIERIEKSGVPEKTVTLYAPASGYVLEKMVLPGQKIMPNDALMVIADLSRVWGETDLYETDIPYVTKGMSTEVTLSYMPGKVFKGRVTFIAPVLDAETRTLKARIEIQNGDLTLKPQMYADAKLFYALGMVLAVPESAVFMTGMRNYVFIEGADDHVIPVEVKTGARSSDGYYAVLSGLKAGDRVVTSASFLVDSESSLKAALKAVTGTGTVPAAAAPSETAPKKSVPGDEHKGHIR